MTTRNIHKSVILTPPPGAVVVVVVVFGVVLVVIGVDVVVVVFVDLALTSWQVLVSPSSQRAINQYVFADGGCHENVPSENV